MANPVLGTCNMVGNVLLASEVGLAAGTILATASPKDLTAIRTPVPETLVLLVRLSSGTATYAVDTTADGTFNSAVTTISNVNDTNFRALPVSTDTTNYYANYRITTSANCIVDRLCILSLSKLTDGEEYRSVLAGRNAVAGLEGTANSDGSGAWLADINVSA